MSDPTVQRIQDWLRAHEQELLADYQEMLRIPSLESAAEPNAPFGKENRRALDLALSLSQKYGFRTTDLDGYIGYAEVGEGPLVMSLGHLDVVPVGDGWKHEPFGAEIDNGYVYARGATDDKGPTMASFYAIRAIKECVPDLKARLRQAFGCNEESGFGCVHHYMEVDEAPKFGIAPDSMWPLVNGEKGIANMHISVGLYKGAVSLLEVKGGQRPNIVIDACTGSVKVDPAVREEVEVKLADNWDQNLSWTWDGDVLNIKAIGKAAHGSTPYYGDSAAARLFRLLFSIAPTEDEEFYRGLLSTTETGGAGLGIHGRDDVSKNLTNNLGVVSTENGRLNLLYNVRYPVTWKGEHLKQLCEAGIAKLKGDWKLDEFHDSPSLYFPLDHPLTKTIIDVYREETGDMAEPGVMGGGTYARAVPNTVSIGTCWEGDGKAHETDERLKIENLYKASRIYAHILYRLALLAAE
jgi:succinyl-diaminopimelate desuccinylase